MKNIDKIEKQRFQEILDLINNSRNNAVKAVNRELIELYWKIGEYISDKCSNEGWGNSVVENLSDFIRKTEPNSKGFSSQNLWSMKQFYEMSHKNKYSYKPGMNIFRWRIPSD